jgi:phosphoadenylyl-sulfate reductase (thioredoxin)
MTPQAILREIFTYCGSKVVMAWGGGMEGMVQLDMAVKINPSVRVFLLDTEKLCDETYALLKTCEERYGIQIERYHPDASARDIMVARHGPELYRTSVELRKLCCYVRKVDPLHRALAGFQGWITALTRYQHEGRSGTPIISIDHAHGDIIKICPLAKMTKAEIRAYIDSNGVPYNPLFDQGYSSIGCACCTRADHPEDGERGNRWWWEPINFDDPNAKECGIHILRD